jgi:multicomponent Na+:H+ antiporter subunit D
MLAQRNLKRLLAFSTIEDMGCLLLGVTLGGELGLTGAMLGATVHVLAKALLFASLSAPEIVKAPTLNMRGMAMLYPISGAGFLLGMLAMLGVPPTLGYAARWRLYAVASQASPWLLAIFMLATILAILAYARVIARFWWGAREDMSATEPQLASPPREPLPLSIALVGLSIILLLTGLWPGLLSG